MDPHGLMKSAAAPAARSSAATAHDPHATTWAISMRTTGALAVGSGPLCSDVCCRVTTTGAVRRARAVRQRLQWSPADLQMVGDSSITHPLT